MGRYGMSVGRYGVAMGCVWGTVGRCVPAPQLSLPTGSGLQLPGAAPTALQLNGALPLGALNPAALTGVGQGAMGRCGVAMGRYGALTGLCGALLGPYGSLWGTDGSL